MSPPLPETTDLERRVLAHERVLQSLIAYMSHTEPRFLEHLKKRFVEPMAMVRHEHDHRNADDYAEEFIRAVMALGETQLPKAASSRDLKKPLHQPKKRQTSAHPYYPTAQADRVRVRERNGIWEVKVDGVFHGDYHDKGIALAAAALARLSL
ncbi:MULTISPECIES: hypothetical protein [Ruegeria]|uniref:Uncharacterized protein n=1 Tax=Ruegeria conchae TaxID=981384 RepID=A0A497ZEY5_9RHOB|nr:hypothetical protein [Ruegeria conchae]RLK07279.1 hypothetical protein CLV75_2395 [Ruegeria conchae]UWR05702.1 hypothetical protein K3740_20845 [Ruegeria conchae]